MSKEDILKLLEAVTTPIYQIEINLGMPKTTLQKALKGGRELPKKWALKLQEAYPRNTKESSPEEKVEPIQDEGIKKESTPNNIAHEVKHPLWQEGDPKEGSISFFNKYRVETYDQLAIKTGKNNVNNTHAEDQSVPIIILGKVGVKVFDSEKLPASQIKNSLMDNQIPPMPIKEDGEPALKYAARKNEWKKKYGSLLLNSNLVKPNNKN